MITIHKSLNDVGTYYRLLRKWGKTKNVVLFE